MYPWQVRSYSHKLEKKQKIKNLNFAESNAPHRTTNVGGSFEP